METFSAAAGASPDLQNTMASKDNDLSTEQFLMYGYKVVPCSKRYRHDWSVCPFAHTGEMAARRDPGRYLPIFCFHSKQRLPCPRGEECPYSHNLFEYWLHPQRYRTEMCQFGASCTRPVCFFAHGDHQLRHTGMPGGPQPVVAPPEPNPALPGAGYNTVTDPVLKQQQQLIALQQAAAGFSNGQLTSTQIRGDTLLPMVDPMQAAAGQGYPNLLDRGGSMDMSALQRELNNVSGYAGGLPASAPLSAPLHQLSPDLLAALNMSQTLSPAPPAHQAPAFSPNGLLHHHNGMTSSYQGSQLPHLAGGGRPLQRSFNTLQDNADPAIMGELAKQLAMMQLMQQNGAANGSRSLPQVVNNGLDDSLMGQLVQLQHKQHQQQQQVAVTAGLSLQTLLASPAASAAMLQQENSYSCPLPLMYGNNSLSGPTHVIAAGRASPRVPAASAAADSAVLCHQLQVGSMSAGPASPTGSAAGSGKDAPAVSSRRDTQDDGSSGGGKKTQQQPWSAPVSPCTSSKGGNDLQVAASDVRMSSISFSTAGGRSSPSHSSNSNNTGSPSSAAASDSLGALSSISELGARPGHHLSSFDAEGAPAARCGDEQASLLMMGGGALQQMLADGNSAAAVAAAVSGGMGKEKAAQLLGQLPEAAVMKLLQLVAQQH